MFKKLLASLAIVVAPINLTTGAVKPSVNDVVVSVPGVAINSSPAIVPLGLSRDVNGRVVEGYMFIHYRSNYSHKPGHNPGGGETTNCFSYLARDAKWKTAEGYLVNPTNTEGIDAATVSAVVSNGFSKWEDATNGIVGDGFGLNIVGNEVAGIVDGPDTVSPDDKNEVVWGDVGSPGAIAVTIVWGIFSGPTFNRELVEWDQVYDQVDFDWTTDGALEPTKMDFDNIVTHEHGHAVGMGHPSDACTEETMYRFASAGETKKRDLGTGDIAGINKLY